MASTEIEFQPGKSKRKGIAGKWDDTKAGIWNPEKGEFIGRTAGSWGKIIVFYSIFYSCLAAFFAIALTIFFQTMNDIHPVQTGMNSLIKSNPGMAFRPMPDIESTLIKFEPGDNSTYQHYVNNIRAFIEKIKKNQDDAEEKNPGSIVDCTAATDGREISESGKACRFDMSELFDGCPESTNYGFDDGVPCVLLKMNRVYDWVPVAYDGGENPYPDDMPATTRDAYDGSGVIVSCEGENYGDIDNLGPVDFYPAQGFLNRYFPYMNVPGYQSPVVFARLSNLKPGVITQVWCKAWASNLYHHKNDKAASAHFEIMMG